MPAADAKVAFIDVETLGLDPHTADLLEIGASVTEGPHYAEIDNGIEVTVFPESLKHLSPAEAVAHIRANCAPVVVEMHTANGLLDDIEAGRAVSLAEGRRIVQQYLQQHEPRQVMILGGNSITLDRNFLEMHAFEVYDHIHYRSIDATSTFEVIRRLPGAPADLVLDIGEDTESEHRALADVRRSIRQMRLMVRMLAGAAVTRPDWRG